MKKLAAAVLMCLVVLLLGGSGAWSAEGIPSDSDEKGWYKCSSTIEEEQKKPKSVFHRADNTTPEEGGRYWKSPLISQTKDAYSVKRPAGNATVTTAVMPASLPKFSKGVTWGVVAVSKKSGKIVRGKITPAGADNQAGQQPAVIIFEEPVEAGFKLIASDRWYNNTILGQRRGELSIWNPGTAKWEKLIGGMWLECDPAHLALVAETYGVPLEQIQHATVTPTEAEQISKKLGFAKVASPDGVRYTPVDIPTFKKLYAKPSLVRWHQRFLNNGGLAIGIPPEPIGTAINIGTAAIVATFDTRHNVPCLSTLGGGQSRFEFDQKFYESGGALYSRDFERVKAEAEKGQIAAVSGSHGAARAGQMGAGRTDIEDLLAKVSPVSPTGYLQPYNYISFWLEPKRVEWPSGGGMFRSPQLRTEYAFSNTYLHLFGGEIAPNATLHWGPATKIDYWKYRSDSGYKGRGHFYGIGGSAELVARHKWGGSDSRFAFWYGLHQLDRGHFHHERRHPWMFEWQTELWWRGIQLGKEGKYGSLLSGAKIGTLAKTNDFLLFWLFPTIYKGPYDLGKISVGWQFLHLFSRDGNEPKGGGLGILFEPIDGLGYRFSYFPFKRGVYHTGWVDPYRIWHKIKELEAEFGICEISWDTYVSTYVSKITPAAISVTPPQPAVSKIKSLPLMPECVKVKVKKYKAKKRVKKAVIKKKEVKEKQPPPCKPVEPKIESPPPIPQKGLRECRQQEVLPKAM